MDKEDVVYIQWKITWPLKNEIMTFAATWMDLEIEQKTKMTLAWRIPGMESLVGCRLRGRTESDTTEAAAAGKFEYKLYIG